MRVRIPQEKTLTGSQRGRGKGILHQARLTRLARTRPRTLSTILDEFRPHLRVKHGRHAPLGDERVLEDVLAEALGIEDRVVDRAGAGRGAVGGALLGAPRLCGGLVRADEAVRYGAGHGAQMEGRARRKGGKDVEEEAEAEAEEKVRRRVVLFVSLPSSLSPIFPP
jgi:hypothetical protein